MVANADLIEDPVPTDVQIREFFDLLNRGRIDRYKMQQVLSLCRSDIDSSLSYDIDSMPDYWIDLNAAPYIPRGWSIRPEDQIQSRARGMWKFDPTKVSLYLSRDQQGIKYIKGNKLKRELENLRVLPANVLDYSRIYRDFIPYSWKWLENGDQRLVCFWGTIYRCSNDHLYVRYLYWRDYECGWYYRSLDDNFYFSNPSAFIAA